MRHRKSANPPEAAGQGAATPGAAPTPAEGQATAVSGVGSIAEAERGRSAIGAIRTSLSPGLYFVSTPIGAARDITLRALDVLASADVLVAEDTRTLRHLMEIHGVPLGGRPLLAYHDHNGEAMRPRILERLAEGRSVAYASEAGTPLVADPGFQLGRSAIAAGGQVIAVPGASAALAALTVSGLPSDRFLFAGFPPPQKGARASFLAGLAPVAATIILYESPRRVGRLLGELSESFGTERRAAVCRELTKRFEEVTRMTLGELAESFAGRDVRGEVVVVIDRATQTDVDPETLLEALRELRGQMSLRDAAQVVSERLGLPRRDVYQAALAMERDG